MNRLDRFSHGEDLAEAEVTNVVRADVVGIEAAEVGCGLNAVGRAAIALEVNSHAGRRVAVVPKRVSVKRPQACVREDRAGLDEIAGTGNAIAEQATGLLAVKRAGAPQSNDGVLKKKQLNY